MTDSEAQQPSLKDRTMSWLKKPGSEKITDAKQAGVDTAKYVARGVEEVGVATGVTPLVREAAGTMTPVVHAATETAVNVSTAIDRGIDRIDQTVQGAGIHLGRGAEIIQKYGALRPFGARV